MDSSVVADLPLPTAHLLGPSADSSRGTDVQVEAAGGRKEPKTRNVRIVASFVALLVKHGYLKKCDGQYMIALGASKSWQLLFENAQSVGSFKFNRDAVLEAAQIFPSVFVYIAQQLKGKPLFPNLTTIELQGLDTSAHYLPLLFSPCLKDVTLKLVLGNPFLEFTVYTFLENMASASPGLQSLKLHNVTGMAHQMLNTIINFQHLHTLQIMRFTDVKNFEELRALGTLASLEYLSLAVEHLTYTRSTQPAQSDAFLPSLKGLHIEAPSDVVSDLILLITSDNLEVFTLRHIPISTADPPEPDPPKLEESKVVIKSKIKKGIRPSNEDSRVNDPVKEKVDFLDNLSSRWPQRLKRVTITSSTHLEIDLRDAARLQALESLEFKGCSIIGVRETFEGPYGFRNSLQVLHLSGYHASLSLLKTIALSTPFLREMTISIDIDERPSPSKISAIIHPLHSLNIDYHSAPKAETTFMFGGHTSEFYLPQLILMARYLNALFPSIQTFTASAREREWGKVWQLLKFCQVSRDDEKSRRPIGECVDAS